MGDDWEKNAETLKKMADARGVVFNQAHAPFGGGYDHYTQKLVPTFPRAFAFCARLGVRQIVVHPLQKGRYYGRERELFDMNMEFYTSLIPLSEEYGIRIAIENMWQTNPVTGRICDDVCANPHELAAYYDTLNDPAHFTVCLDIGHVALCGREPEDAIRVLGHDRLGALHVHDVDYINDLHTIPYVGRVNWDNVVNALAEIRYKGEFTMESDAFLHKYPDDFMPTAARFMADTTRYLAEKLEKML
jgi:sugar phosphate isomerase/epimerase